MVLRTRVAASLSLMLALAGCGGGVYLGWGWDDDDDDDPDVSLDVSADSAAAGEAVELIAAASDENGIEQVAFFRIENGGDVLLGADDDAPFRWTAVIPSNAAGSVRFVAVATDRPGNRSESNIVSVDVLP